MSENIAKEVFEKAGYETTQEEIKKFGDNIAILDGRGLGQLNQRLQQGGRRVWDTIAEHNFAVDLVSQHRSAQVEYEPSELSPPPDFKIQLNDITYWVQMKNSSALERENRQNRIIEQMRRSLEKVPIKKFFGCDLSAQFIDNAEEEDVELLTKFISEAASDGTEDKVHSCLLNNIKVAEVTFWYPQKIPLLGLSYGASGDLEMENITGFAKEQIKKSLIKATKAFGWEVSRNVINLIALDADRQDDIDLCDAIFGTEFDWAQGDRSGWSRQDDGFFHDNEVSKKILGVIILKKKERTQISGYEAMLYINDAFKDRLDDIKDFLPFTKIVYRNMRPKMGEGNFKPAMNSDG